MRTVRIEFGPLPYRSRALREDETTAIFGGCVTAWKPCRKTTDCCAWDAGYECKPTHTPPGCSEGCCQRA